MVTTSLTTDQITIFQVDLNLAVHVYNAKLVSALIGVPATARSIMCEGYQRGVCGNAIDLPLAVLDISISSFTLDVVRNSQEAVVTKVYDHTVNIPSTQSIIASLNTVVGSIRDGDTPSHHTRMIHSVNGSLVPVSAPSPGDTSFATDVSRILLPRDDRSVTIIAQTDDTLCTRYGPRLHISLAETMVFNLHVCPSFARLSPEFQNILLSEGLITTMNAFYDNPRQIEYNIPDLSRDLSIIPAACVSCSGENCIMVVPDSHPYCLASAFYFFNLI